MEVTLLPKLKQDASLDDFNCWLTEFSAFVDLCVDKDNVDDKGVRMLKYSVAGARLNIHFDERTTYQSGLEKVKKVFRTCHAPALPLSDFFNNKWFQSEDGFSSYVAKLRSKLIFISSEKCKDEIILQHCLEQLKPELRVLLR